MWRNWYIRFWNFICKNATENADGYRSTQLGIHRRYKFVRAKKNFCSSFWKVKCLQNEIKPGYRNSLKAFCNIVGCHVLLRRVGRHHLAARLRFSGLPVAHACTRTNNMGAPCAADSPHHLGNTCIFLLVALKLTQRFERSRTSRNSVHGRDKIYIPPQFPHLQLRPLIFLDIVN